jgi:hypothetical protein
MFGGGVGGGGAFVAGGGGAFGAPTPLSDAEQFLSAASDLRIQVIQLQEQVAELDYNGGSDPKGKYKGNA